MKWTEQGLLCHYLLAPNLRLVISKLQLGQVTFLSKVLTCKMGTLVRSTCQACGEGKRVLYTDAQPWPGPVLVSSQYVSAA